MVVKGIFCVKGQSSAITCLPLIVLDDVRVVGAKAGLEFPIVIDNQKRNWDAWGNSMWPSTYLIDKEGYVRYWWYGELNWKGAEGEALLRKRIEELLAE